MEQKPKQSTENFIKQQSLKRRKQLFLKNPTFKQRNPLQLNRPLSLTIYTRLRKAADRCS